MLQFYLIAGLLIALALLFLLWPLLLESKDELGRRTTALKDALDALKLKRANDEMSEAEYQAERERINLKLLALMDAPLKPPRNKSNELPSARCGHGTSSEHGACSSSC
jgi:hypothetical protein